MTLLSRLKIGEIHDTDIYDAFEKIHDRKTLLTAINTTESAYSRWRSPKVEGEDNHRRGPLEVINAMETYARAELNKAEEYGNT